MHLHAACDGLAIQQQCWAPLLAWLVNPMSQVTHRIMEDFRQQLLLSESRSQNSIIPISQFGNDEATSNATLKVRRMFLLLSFRRDSRAWAAASQPCLALGPAAIGLASTTSTQEILSLLKNFTSNCRRVGITWWKRAQ